MSLLISTYFIYTFHHSLEVIDFNLPSLGKKSNHFYFPGSIFSFPMQGSTLRPARLPGAGKNFKKSVRAGDFDIVPARQGR